MKGVLIGRCDVLHFFEKNRAVDIATLVTTDKRRQCIVRNGTHDNLIFIVAVTERRANIGKLIVAVVDDELRPFLARFGEHFYGERNSGENIGVDFVGKNARSSAENLTFTNRHRFCLLENLGRIKACTEILVRGALREVYFVEIKVSAVIEDNATFPPLRLQRSVRSSIASSMDKRCSAS